MPRMEICSWIHAAGKICSSDCKPCHRHIPKVCTSTMDSEACPDEATALTDNVSRHMLHEFPFFVKIPVARVIPAPAKLFRRDTHLHSKAPALQS